MPPTPPRPDPTGLHREYAVQDAIALHPSLAGRHLPLMPEWVTHYTRAPGALAFASLARPLLAELAVPDSVAEAAHLFVRNFAKDRKDNKGSALIIMGQTSRTARRVLAAGAMNEIVRVFSHYADVTPAWISPRSLESLSIKAARDAEGYAAVYSQLANAKIAVMDDLNQSMVEYRILAESIMYDRLTARLPTVLVMTTSPVFSDDLAEEYTASYHYRAIFPD